MNLILFFRLIMCSLFQKQVTYDKMGRHGEMGYDHQLFYCPRVWARDGFNVSLQVHSGNYCSSENGYRTFGFTMQEIEFGFPTIDEPDMYDYAEEPNKLTNTVGRIPIDVMQAIFEKHGGIDWEKTISIEQCKTIMREE